MIAPMWLGGLMRRRRARLVGTSIGAALAVGLLSSIGTFLAASKATMTQRASTSVNIDWQVEAQPGADPTALLTAVTKFRGIKAAVPVGFGKTAGFELTSGNSTQTTGPGVVLGMPANYRTVFPDVIRDLSGATTGVLLTQQTAANLHAAPGDSITMRLASLPPVTLKIDGIIDVTAADSIFQKVGAPPQSQPKAPPDNVLVLPIEQWHTIFDPLAVTRPDLVTTQIHADVNEPLPSDPSAAYFKIESEGRNLELALAGTGLVGNNLGAKLGSARSDSLYAQVLFLFLGVPGAVLAGLLTITAASAGATRRRRDHALLRTRGASVKQLLRLALAESIFTTAIGSAVGLATALVVGRVAFSSTSFGTSFSNAAGWASASVFVGAMIAGLAILWPAWRDARETSVAAARRTVGRSANPRWMRYGLDVILLALSWLVFWLTSRNGFRLVLAVEGIPTISVNYWAFAGPALLWVGGGLLVWRIAVMALQHGQPIVRRLIQPISGGLAETVAASMGRQRKLLARGLAVIALTAAFASSTSIFNSTYQQQAEVDAVLSNGAMVTVVNSPGVTTGPEHAAQLAAVSGVRSVTPLQHRFAYVGADLQDLYGVDPATIVASTKLQDTYFTGGSANALMTKLATQPNAVLVSQETVKDFQLKPGDTIKLRLQDGRTKQYTPVPFVYVGIAKKFPSAPSDSFIVANASYIAASTGTNGVGTFLIDTDPRGSTAVADRVQKLEGTNAIVKDIASKRRKIGNSLTSVELAGLTKVELGFALILAAAASGLMLWLGLAERRRTFAIATALGAKRRQLGGFIWSEASFVTIGGLALGAITGWALTKMIIKILTGVFDPPPTTLAIPWGYLGIVVGVMAAAVVGACVASMRDAKRPDISQLRDL